MDWYSIQISRTRSFAASAGQVAKPVAKNGFRGVLQRACCLALAAAVAIATSETDGNGVVTTKFGNFTTDFNGALNFVLASPVKHRIGGRRRVWISRPITRRTFSPGCSICVCLGNYNDERTRNHPETTPVLPWLPLMAPGANRQ